MEFSIGRQIAAIRIDSKCSGRVSAGYRVTDLAGDRDRSNPGQRVRKIAEAFAEKHGWRVGIERVGPDALRARPAPFDAKADRHHELMFRILEHTVFEGRLQVLKAACSHPGRSSRRAEAAEGRSKRHRERLGNPLGEFGGNIALSE